MFIDSHQRKNFGFAVAVTFVLFFFGARLAIAQEKPPPTSPATSERNVNLITAAGQDENYLLKPGDVIDVRVEKAPELSGTYFLNNAGTIDFPILGLIKAEKQTLEDLTKTIGDKLRGSYLMNPIVFVSVKERKTKVFFIQGAVNNPGTYRVEGNPSLLTLITIAGGLKDNYGSTAFVIRKKKIAERPDTDRQPGSDHGTGMTTVNAVAKSDQSITGAGTSPDSDNDTEYELIKANINSLLRGSFEQNIVIQQNDIVHIPKSDIFFVTGEVKAPGNFPLREGTTLRQAISLAQGTKFEGAADRGIIFREDQSGKRQEILVDIGSVMAGKKKDIDILPNDIIMIPNSKSKTLASGAFKTVSNGLLRTLFGF